MYILIDEEISVGIPFGKVMSNEEHFTLGEEQFKNRVRLSGKLLLLLFPRGSFLKVVPTSKL